MSQSKFGLTGVQLWPTMIFTRLWEAAASENPKIVGHIQQLRQLQRHPIESGIAVGSKSAQGIFESGFDFLQDGNEATARLAEFIRATLATAICVANGNEKRPEQLSIEIIDSWYHVTNQHGFHDAHVHHGCSWCGIYYVDVGGVGTRSTGGAPNGGSRFYSPLNSGGGYRDYGNKYLAAFADPPVENGLLLLFPSYLLHSGLPYIGSEDRIVIAFNVRAFVSG